MHDDEVQCPYCGTSGEFAWCGSNYVDETDVDFVEDALYTCPGCGKDYSAHITYRLVDIEIRKI